MPQWTLYKVEQNGASGNLLNLVLGFLDARKQIVFLNGHCFSLARVIAKVFQGSILGPRFLPIFINDLSRNLASNPQLFLDYTCFFSVVQDFTLSANNLNDDLSKINIWLVKNEF